MIYETYKKAETQLKSDGFNYQSGMPLYGSRFMNSKNEYAFIFRIDNNNYNIHYV